MSALEDLVGPVRRLDPVPRGYTHNDRSVAVLTDGSTVFVKQAVDTETAGWLRREYEMYTALAGRSFMAEVVAWGDGERPILVLEDLSGAVWPPPWDSGRIDAVLGLLDAVSASPRPHGLPLLVEESDLDNGWEHVLHDPTEFLSLGLADGTWLTGAGPA
ncbi:MAG: hypothetical protein ACRDY1_10620, partial [Acidimicrobiales bacterium]